MEVIKKNGRENFEFRNNEGYTLRLSSDNRGEPYDAGICLELERPQDEYAEYSIFLGYEELPDFLNALYRIRPNYVEKAQTQAIFALIRSAIEQNGDLTLEKLERLERTILKG